MNHSFKADSVMLLVTFLASSGWLFSKFALEGLPPMAFLGIRFTLAALLLGCFFGRGFFLLNKRQWIIVGQIGLAQTVAMLLWILAINSATELGGGAFITSTSMIMVPVMARLLFKVPLPRKIIMGLPLSLLGIALLALDNSWHIDWTQFLFFLSAISLAVHFNLISRYGSHLPAMIVAGLPLLMVGMSGLLLSILTEPWPDKISVNILGWLTASIVIATSLRFFLQSWGQPRADIHHAAVIMILEPVWTTIMSALWLSESLSWQKVSGCLLVFTALLISRVRWPFVMRKA
ncbi:hypothetical protein CI610_02654 [invertebrate metagenome]|uniref:EamA domain-containing protein n=1 Tax=invertebrate metagenome TaxID=1711999 RepID=A0A2H9T5B8_9ZZZZ